MASACACALAPVGQFCPHAAARAARNFLRRKNRSMLPRSARLTTTSEISGVVRRGSRVQSGPLVLHHLPGRRGPRFAFIVTKSHGNAPQRNLLRRRLRAIARQVMDPLTGDFVVRVRPDLGDASWSRLSRAFTQCVRSCVSLESVDERATDQ